MQSEDIQSLRKQYPYVAWAILAAYSLLLVCQAHCHIRAGQTTPRAVWELRGSCWIVEWIGGIALGALRESAFFIPVGFIAAMAVSSGPRPSRRFSVHLQALAIASILTILVHGARMVGSWSWAAVVGLTFPLLGCLFGLWAGATWLRGRHTRFWFLPKVALLALTVVLGTSIALWLSLEDTPLPFETARAASDERQRLVQMIRSNSPKSLEKDQTHTLQLTEHDVNVLLGSIFSFESSQRKAAVRLGRDCASLWMSLPAQLGEGRLRYLNLEVAGSARIVDGIVRLRGDRLRIGPVELPRWLVHSLGPLATSLLNHDPCTKPFLKATKRMVIESDSFQLTYGSLDLPAEHGGRILRSSIATEELLAATRAQVNHLLLLFAAGSSPDLQLDFGLCLKTAFALARKRSSQHDAITENRAALLGLGILLGHPRIEDFLGEVVADADTELVRQVLPRVVLYGRSDWTRHFYLSAAITILSDETLSDVCGLLKEELDADADGSGFSFADLLVDRAGTMFAVHATRDVAAALAMQDRILQDFHTEDVCPPAGDLPEGVSEADLRSCYGGRDGEGYRGLIEEIERRVVACAAYR